MAPDLNSVPSSPRLDRNTLSNASSTAASRRTSQIMAPPAFPASSTSPVQNQHSHAHHHVPPPHRSPVIMSNEQTGVPLRHPRPLTAAELYLECEKEQEAVVNRLTRELTTLRAQSASVASNASHSSTSTSASLLPVDISDPNPTHQMTGATHPTPSRRHRSSSSLSTRSAQTPSSTAPSTTSAATNVSTAVQAGSTTSVPMGGVSQASADRQAAAGGSLSRQPSISASGNSTPARQSLDLPRTSHGDPHQQRGTLYTLPHRPSASRDPSFTSQTTSSTAAHAGTPFPHPLPSPVQSPSQSVSVAMQHYADTAAYRSEMEIVKAENEALRQRVRALERALRTRRRDSSVSDAPRTDTNVRSVREASGAGGVAGWDSGVGGVAGPRERSESQSTTASSRRGGGVAIEDDVRFGESAGSMGVGQGR